jgi:hypothetical protein
MLTITETIDVILAIDTDAEVIRNACEKLLKDHEAKANAKFHAELSEEGILVNEILKKYNGKVPTAELIQSLASALAILAAGSVKVGRESNALKTILEYVEEQYMKVCEARFEDRLRKDSRAGR